MITGKRHNFVPFSPRTNKATYFPDTYEAEQGNVLHIIVAGVRGKTVVVFMDNLALPADQPNLSRESRRRSQDAQVPLIGPR